MPDEEENPLYPLIFYMDGDEPSMRLKNSLAQVEARYHSLKLKYLEDLLEGEDDNFSVNGSESSMGLNIAQIEARYPCLKKLKSSDNDIRILVEGLDLKTEEKVVIEKFSNVFENKLDLYILRQMEIYMGLPSCIGIRKLQNIMIPLGEPEEEEPKFKFKDVYLVYRWMADFDLLYYKDKLSKLELPEGEGEGEEKKKEKKIEFWIASTLWQLVNAVYHLHLAGVVHGSIDQASVVVSSDATSMQLYNFIWSAPEHEAYTEDENADEDEEMIRSTLVYRAPEILLGKDGYNTSAFDMWCMGCFFNYVLEGPVLRIPSGTAATVENQFIHLLKTLRPSVQDIDFITPETTSSKINIILQQYKEEYIMQQENNDEFDYSFDLVHKMLAFNPSKRIKAHEALQHPYFDKGLVYLHNDEPLERKMAALSEAFQLKISGNKLERNQIRDLMWEKKLTFRPPH